VLIMSGPGKKNNIKIRYRAMLLDYLGDPEKDFPLRKDYIKIMKVSHNKTLYKHFTPDEITDLENEAVELRKRRASRQRSIVLEALYNKAKGYKAKVKKPVKLIDGSWEQAELEQEFQPCHKSAKEFLDRTEGKVVEKKEISGPGGKELVPILNVTYTREDD